MNEHGRTKTIYARGVKVWHIFDGYDCDPSLLDTTSWCGRFFSALDDITTVKHRKSLCMQCMEAKRKGKRHQARI